MMYLLEQGFYKIFSRNKEENKLTINMQFEFNHSIFNGHFPNQPVVPGVSMIQIIKENMEEYLKTNLTISSTGQLKFLNSIIPAQSDFYTIEINFHTNEDNTIKADSQIKDLTTTYFKGVLNFKR